jgi:tetratricopeptide (TPR) repeat protein
MYMRSLLLLLITLSAALNSACAHNATEQSYLASAQLHAQQDQQETLDERARRMLNKAPVGPGSDVDTDLMFKFLVAEVAGQRGDFDVASDAYLELARATNDPRVARRATEFALYAKRQDAALESAKIWYATDPTSDSARRTLADLYVKSGNLASARPLLVQVLANSQSGPQPVLMQLYELCSGYPDKQAVYEMVSELVKPYSDLPEAHFALAQAALASGDLQQAIGQADEALELRPDWQQGVLLKSVLLGQQDRSAAIAYLHDFLQLHPDAHEIRLNYARALIAEKRYEEAKQEFQILLTANSKNANLAYTLGLLSAQINDLEGADKQFRNALELGYGNPDAIYFQLGQVNERLKRPDEAARWYRSVQDGDQFVPAQARYAMLIARRDGIDKARSYLHSLEVTDDEQRVQLIQAEAQLLRQMQDYQQCYEVLRDALKERPDQPALLYDAALAAEKVDRLDDAESRLRKLIELEPDSAQAYNALGYTLADRTDRFDEARRYIVKALALAPNDPFILDSMGWVEYRMGNLDEALRYLRRAYDMQPDPEIAAHLGEVLWVNGARQDAQRIWSDSAHQYPDNETLQQAMRKFLGT